MQTEKHKWQYHKARVRKREEGAEQLVVVKKSRKRDGAKGLWQGVEGIGKPAMGDTVAFDKPAAGDAYSMFGP
jgi:hypothetical protein